jgi:hypothetical protein
MRIFLLLRNVLPTRPACGHTTYIHRLDDDLPEPSFLDGITGAQGGNGVATRASEVGRDETLVAAGGTN